MTTTTTTPPVVNSWFTELEHILVKVGGIAAFVTGAVTAANSNLPHFESAIVSTIGGAVFVLERYWGDFKKLL